MPASSPSDWLRLHSAGSRILPGREVYRLPTLSLLVLLPRAAAEVGGKSWREEFSGKEQAILMGSWRAFLFSPLLLWSQSRGVRLMFLLLTLHLGSWWVNARTENYSSVPTPARCLFLFFPPKNHSKSFGFISPGTCAVFPHPFLFWGGLPISRQKEMNLCVEHGGYSSCFRLETWSKLVKTQLLGRGRGGRNGFPTKFSE